jgi:hypothetical protein
MIPMFYGVKLDKNDPYLEHNLDRLEKRFKGRYLASLDKNRQREKLGKPTHQTVLRSLEDNKKRCVMTTILKKILFDVQQD